MKPPIFDYACPESLDEALRLLAQHGSDAKVLAGGQSLMPLLNFRMLKPGALIDINRVGDLADLREDRQGLRIGALTRHRTLESSPLVARRFPVLAAAMRHVAHLAIRNRGTIGGSLAHADPAAELPMIALLLDADLQVRSQAGARSIAAADFFLAPLTTALEENEIVTEVLLPCLSQNCGWGFEEFSQRSGDFAIAAVAVLLKLDSGNVSIVRLAAMGVDETPVRFRDIEADIVGTRFSAGLAADVAQRASETVNPAADLKASSEYRRHLLRVLMKRALMKAAGQPERAAA